jgi:hypothetical protein
MVRILEWTAATALSLLAASPALAMRCGTHLVHEGDTRSLVASKCGAPAEISHSSVLRRPVIWRHGRPYFLSADVVQIPVEFWIYNLGPNKFMRRLRFEDGLVTEIETLGYGYHEK